MKNEEIISFLRNQKANDPVMYEKYITYYKEKYPDFYKDVLMPELEPPSAKPTEIEGPKLPPAANPSEMFSTSDVKPIGSADVGEISYKEGFEAEVDIPKPEMVKSAIKKDVPVTTIVLVGIGIIVVIGVITALVFLL